MNKRRLLKLANLLESDAGNKKGIRFDLSTIARRAPATEFDWWREFRPGEKPALDCGTAACAVGLAAISGAFKREGFGYKVSKNFGLQPTYKGSRIFQRATTRFFEISEGECDFLFMPESYSGITTGARGERRVAKRVRDFVAGKARPDND